MKMCGKIYKTAVSLLCSLFCLCAAVMFAGCESPKVERINAEQVTDLSGYWNDTDVRLVANTLIKECTEAPAIAAYIRANGKMPVVIVGTFRNQSDEHIDTSILVKKFEAALVPQAVDRRKFGNKKTYNEIESPFLILRYERVCAQPSVFVHTDMFRFLRFGRSCRL